MPQTNRGAYRQSLGWWLRDSLPTHFYIHLVKGTLPTRLTNKLSELTQIENGNGYSVAGVQLTPGETDFEEIIEDDLQFTAFVTVRDIVWTASGGTIPSDGQGAEAAVICDDNATVANRDVLAWWPFAGPVIVSDGQPLTVELLKFRSRTQ